MNIQSASLNKQRLLPHVTAVLRAQGIEAYLVGGAVRDLLRGQDRLVDLDFAVPGDGLAVARRVAQALDAAFYPLDPERGVGRIVYHTPLPLAGQESEKCYLDFATFRGATLQEDLADRDFTINAMALTMAESPELIDPLNGWRDLELGRIRTTSPAAFRHDPVRVLRAVRQATDFGFLIEAETEQYLRQAASLLVKTSPERQRDELVKLLNTPAPGRAITSLHELDVLPHFLPELEPMSGVGQSSPHHLDVFQHTAAALDNWAFLNRAGWPDLPAAFLPGLTRYLQQPLAGDMTQELAMPLAVLLHDTGKPATRSESRETGQTRVRFLGHEQESARIARRMLRRFRFSSQATEFVETVVRHHMRPLLLAQAGSASRRAIYRFFRHTSGSGFQAGLAVALHALADHRATYPPGLGRPEEQALLGVINRLLVAYFENHTQVVDPPLLLSGRDIISTFGIGEGRLVGQLLRRLKEAQATGAVDTRAEALAFIETELGRTDSDDESAEDSYGTEDY